nr:hypothetical protein [Paenibacillus luteus]
MKGIQTGLADAGFAALLVWKLLEKLLREFFVKAPAIRLIFVNGFHSAMVRLAT